MFAKGMENHGIAIDYLERVFHAHGIKYNYVSATDQEALDAFQLCCRLEGIIPALEPAHALAYVGKLAPDLPAEHLLVMNMCGRGDKDVFAVAEVLGEVI